VEDYVDLPEPARAAPPLTARGRLRAFLDMWLVDHGFIRDIYSNTHRISPKAWRSAQPAPHHLARAKRMGIRTIINLRGRREDCGAYILEQEACVRLGLTLVDFPVRSRKPMEKPTLLAAIDLFERVEYPILLHCKSGADRAGLISTLYLHIHEGMPLREAMRHLSLRYGHVRQAKTGVIDMLYESYLADNERSPISFRDWAERVYDPAVLEARFHENWAAGILVNKILRRE
jgi:protein tyrosine/serine phosphatase